MITPDSLEMLTEDEIRILKIALPVGVVHKLVMWEKALLTQKQDAIGAYDQDDRDVLNRTREIFVMKTVLDSILYFFTNLPEEKELSDGIDSN